MNSSSLRRMLVVLFATTLVSGCDGEPLRWLLKLLGEQSEVVVLSKTPAKISDKPLVLKPEKALLVVGNSNAVCLSLTGNGDFAWGLEYIKSEYLKSAKVEAQLILEDGSRVTASSIGSSWRSFGVIEARDEVAACLGRAVGCGPDKTEAPALAIGTKVIRVELTSSVPIEVRGVYWESEERPLGPNEVAPKKVESKERQADSSKVSEGSKAKRCG